MDPFGRFIWDEEGHAYEFSHFNPHAEELFERRPCRTTYAIDELTRLDHFSEVALRRVPSMDLPKPCSKCGRSS